MGDKRMKTLKSFILLLALTGLLVKAQTSSEISYEDTIEGLFNKTDAEGRTFRPLLNELHVNTVGRTNFNPEDEDGSAMTTKQLSFLAEETMCNETLEQPEKQCPPRHEGQLLSCNLVVTHPVEDISNIITSEMSCEKMEPEDALKPKIRQRRGVRSWFAKKGRRLRKWWKNKKYERRLSYKSFQTWMQNQKDGVSNWLNPYHKTYQRWWNDLSFRKWVASRARRIQNEEFQTRLSYRSFRRWVRNRMKGASNRWNLWNSTYRRWWRNKTFRTWVIKQQRIQKE